MPTKSKPPEPTRAATLQRAPPDAAPPPPAIATRFFYTSAFAIDDPLAPLPPLSSGSKSGPAGGKQGSGAAHAPPGEVTATRVPPRPFSTRDHRALEEAWLELRRKRLRRGEDEHKGGGEHERRRRAPGQGDSPVQSGSANGSSSRSRVRGGSDSESRARAVPARRDGASAVGGQDSGDAAEQGRSLPESLRAAEPMQYGHGAEAPSTTGTPFVRAPSRTSVPAAASAPFRRAQDDGEGSDDEARQRGRPPEPTIRALATKTPVGVSRLHEVVMPELKMEPIYWSPVNDVADVARGTWFYRDAMLPVETEVANLLEAGYVELEPWTQTWTDQLDSAVDVGAAGEMKILHRLWPEKPRRAESRPSTARAGEAGGNMRSGEAEEESPEKDRQEAVAVAADMIDLSTGTNGPDHKAAGRAPFGRDGTKRLYRTSGIIYANERDAYVLRPSLQPSAYYGRRPLANYIRKGRSIGIRVVRGFDQDAWDRLHPPKRAQGGVKAEAEPVTDLVLVIHGIGQKLSERIESFHFTHAINAFRRQMNVELGTDAVRMHVRKGMGGTMVLPVNWRLSLSFEDGGYRDDAAHGGASANQYSLRDITPATLPSVRNIISDVMLDIPYYLSQEHHPKMLAACVAEANRIYRLWCRNNPGFSQRGRVHLIAHSLGSVMAIDILSQQPTRVPPWAADPHPPAPSPTPVPPAATDLPTDHFLFDTHSLFTCGSPVGFFLLLNNASLLPRRDARKCLDAPDPVPAGVAGPRGTYGCLAVHNIYNVINPYDPVAYALNATVDAAYAAALKPALVPSAAAGWLAGIVTNPFRAAASGTTSSRPGTAASAHAPTSAQLPTATTDALLAAPSSTTTNDGMGTLGSSMDDSAFALPTSPTTRLPASVELETHDFSRESAAERRAALLNDNAQVDWFLRWGGGPLDFIPYLTMLGAHSSYWVSRDFVRMVAVEVGRRPGRAGTVVGMRAVKRKRRV